MISKMIRILAILWMVASCHAFTAPVHGIRHPSLCPWLLRQLHLNGYHLYNPIDSLATPSPLAENPLHTDFAVREHEMNRSCPVSRSSWHCSVEGCCVCHLARLPEARQGLACLISPNRPLDERGRCHSRLQARGNPRLPLPALYIDPLP